MSPTSNNVPDEQWNGSKKYYVSTNGIHISAAIRLQASIEKAKHKLTIQR